MREIDDNQRLRSKKSSLRKAHRSYNEVVHAYLCKGQNAKGVFNDVAAVFHSYHIFPNFLLFNFSLRFLQLYILCIVKWNFHT